MTIQRLNMDNSWRLEFAGKSILIDPWLKGEEVDYFSWFNTQWHRTKPISPSEVIDFDLVIITQKYPDHFHPETLLDLQPENLLVPKSIEKKVRKLLPNATVLNFNDSPTNIFNSYINVHFLPTSRRIDPIYDALVLENGNESILIATHGYNKLEEWTERLKNLPPVKLAFTPFNKYQLPVFLGGTVAPGLDAVKNLIQAVNPQKIVATHDEDKHAKGIVHKFANITFSPSKEELLKDDLFADRLMYITNNEIHAV